MRDAQTRFEALHAVRTPVLEIVYAELGPTDGPAVVLLHGYPYDIHSYIDVAPILAGRGFRVLVPYLRGHGATRFLARTTPRSGEQAALGRDVIDLLDALGLPRAILAGYDWGGRAACVAAALWPHRVDGLVSVNGYLIQDLTSAMVPLDAELEAGFWYFFYFLTDRGFAGLDRYRREIAEVIWRRNSPDWRFDEAILDRAAEAFRNPDYVDVVIHSYRHRLGYAPGADEYMAEQSALAALPSIRVPAVTLDGVADGNFPPTDGTASAARFAGPRVHHQIPHAGHNLPQEAPFAFAQAVLEVARLAELEHAQRSAV
ncbi:MAG: alpha/beta fold hydrolase [Protaetiibacter sp.]